jgi:D-sedoheptulose 7-phosphate isomerase
MWAVAKTPHSPYIDQISKAIAAPSFLAGVDTASEILNVCGADFGRVYVCGNGGSAALASHFAQDLRKAIGMKAYCLSDSVPFLTAVANDQSYADVFMEYLRAEQLRVADVLVAISCSGESENVFHAAASAKKWGGCDVIILTGEPGSQLVNLGGDAVIVAEHDDIRGQEDVLAIACHLIVRSLSDLVE